MSLNKVQLIGNLGKDPELKQFQNGGQICNVSIATTDKGYTTKDGNVIEAKTEWHNITFTNKLAGVAAQYLKKGSKIYVEGKLSTRSYEDKSGTTKYVTEIRAINMEMLDSKPQQGQQQQGGYQQQPVQQQQVNPYTQQAPPAQQGGYQQGPPPAQQNYQQNNNNDGLPF